MNAGRIRRADALAGACGLAMLVFLSLDWYTLPQGGVTGWAAFSVLDKLLALVAILGLVLPVVTAWRDTPAWPTALTVLIPAIAFLIAPFFLYRLFDQPGLDADVDVVAGMWLGGFALLGLFVSGALAQRDESAPGLPEPRDIPVMPAPPRETPGPSPTES